MYLNLLKRNDIFNIVIKKYITFNANNYNKKLFDSSSKGQQAKFKKDLYGVLANASDYERLLKLLPQFKEEISVINEKFLQIRLEQLQIDFKEDDFIKAMYEMNTVNQLSKDSKLFANEILKNNIQNIQNLNSLFTILMKKGLLNYSDFIQKTLIQRIREIIEQYKFRDNGQLLCSLLEIVQKYEGNNEFQKNLIIKYKDFILKNINLFDLDNLIRIFILYEDDSFRFQIIHQIDEFLLIIDSDQIQLLVDIIITSNNYQKLHKNTHQLLINLQNHRNINKSSVEQILQFFKKQNQ